MTEIDERPPIDLQWYERMRTTKPDFLARLLDVYLEEEPKRLAALSAAVDAADKAHIAYLAHSLKGAAATLGMERLRDVCRDLEQAAKADEAVALPELLRHVHAEITAVFDFIVANRRPA